jgi:hypothetical protein
LPPTIQRIAGSWAQQLGVVHVLVSGQTTEHRLLQQTDQCMAAVSTGRVSASISPAVEVNPSESSSSGYANNPPSDGDHGAAKLQHHAPIKIELESPVV